MSCAVLGCCFIGLGYMEQLPNHKPVHQLSTKHQTKVTPTTTPKPVAVSKPQTVATVPQTTNPTPTPAPVAKPTPTPAPASTPSPGKGVNSLQPAPASGQSGTSGSSGSSGTSGSGQNTYTPATYSSTNWSGYFAHTASYTGISGSWTVPSVSGSGTTSSADSAWIGIGGASTSDLIQIGTLDSVSASGTVTYYAFYELLPASALLLNGFPVQAGDEMSANIKETTTDTWSVTITDDTSDQTYTTTVSYDSSLSSAEWIEEDPSYRFGLIPFDTFGSITFSGAATTVSGTSENLSAADADLIIMVDDSGSSLATPSALTGGGSRFTVTQN